MTADEDTDVRRADEPAHLARQGTGKQRPRTARPEIAMAILSLVIVLLAGTSVTIASQAQPTVPRALTRPDLLLAPRPTSTATAVAATATPATCPCLAGQPQSLSVPLPKGGTPALSGHVLVVDLSQQWLWAYDNRQLVYATAVTTGQPALPTPTGTFRISQKITNTWFISPWPYGSPFYYTPVHVDVAMLFRSGGFFIHDAPWRSDFGPGTNLPHIAPGGQSETGSHGCIEVPVAAGYWLYAWTAMGTTVIIRG